jgi:hypothetical protein
VKAKEKTMTDLYLEKLVRQMKRTIRHVRDEMGRFQTISCGSKCCDIDTLYWTRQIATLRRAIAEMQLYDQDRAAAYEQLDDERGGDDK